MVASDVVALFPSMKVKNTAKICAEMVKQTELEFEDLDICEMLLYIRMNQEKVSNLQEVEPWLPTRAKKGGVAPGLEFMKCIFRMTRTPSCGALQ